ncbi:MAG: FAD-dependent oxidoreductase, partial [Chloroflexi bacterium]|nr:FAD-dependent oxidoreductase [Chloroflexota bacterium]
MRVGIIGAGAAGLAAAYELGKHGHQALVYERAPFLGGQASTFDVGGARLERGYHHWFTNDTDIIDLVEEIGLGHQIRWIDSTVGTLYDGKIYNFVTPMDLLKFTPLSLPDRIRLGLLTLYLQRKKDWRGYENITADEWLRKHAGKRGYEVFWGPMLRGKFGEDYYDQVGMPWVWGKVHTRVASRGKSMLKEKLGYPIGSFGEVFDVLAQRIEEQG